MLLKSQKFWFQNIKTESKVRKFLSEKKNFKHNYLRKKVILSKIKYKSNDRLINIVKNDIKVCKFNDIKVNLNKI